MYTNKYSILLKVVETKSFTKAARYFQYTQSAISQMIKGLEKEFQVTLFLRTKAGIEPTEECKHLLPYIQQIVIGDQNLHEQISELHNLQRGIIRLGSYLSISTHLLPSSLHSFKKEYPNISFELCQDNDEGLLEKLSNGTVDFCIMSDPGKRDFEFTNKLFDDPFVAVLPENHPLAVKKRLSVSDILHEPFISLSSVYSYYYDVIFQDTGLYPDIIYDMADDLSVIAMVEQNHGITLLPKFVTEKNVFKVRTAELDPPCHRTIGIVSRKGAYYSWASKSFIRYLINYIKETGGK